MEKQKGITLIALIITIIVMLIMVGVTVNVALTGGLFDTARKARKLHKREALYEEINSIIVSMNADIVSNPSKYKNSSYGDDEYNGERFMRVPLVELEKNFEISDEEIISTRNDGTEDIKYLDIEIMFAKGILKVNADETEYILTVPCKYKENNVNIKVKIENGDDDAYITEFSLGSLSYISLTLTTEEATVGPNENIKAFTADGVPIPKGFYFVTGDKNTGVVISDSPDDENNESGNNGNQFVWVPVGINPKLNIEIESDKTISSIRMLDLNDNDETIAVNSDVFNKTIDLTGNGIIEFIINYEDGTKETKMAYIDNCYEKNELELTVKTTSTLLAGGNDEILFDYLRQLILEEDPNEDVETNISIIKHPNMNLENLGIDNPVEKDNVLEYGGFYIGRYEAGKDLDDDAKTSIRKGQEIRNNISFTDAKTEAENMYNNSEAYGVKSALTTGAAWDSVCRWLEKTNENSFADIYLYCGKEKGNYRTARNDNRNLLKKSGSSEGYKINNIYDLAGNISEWTTETNADGTSNITRGGNYDDYSGAPYNCVSHSYRKEYYSADTKVGYRPILYFYND